MALSTESSNLVWQKVKVALLDASPAIQNAFLDLKMYLATQGGNPNLQFIPFSEAQSIVNLGTDLVGGASTLYGCYAKAVRTTGTTAAFFSINAAADNSATTATILTQRFKATGQKVCAIYPTGVAVETGLTVSSATTVGGATESTTPDGVAGFVVVG